MSKGGNTEAQKKLALFYEGDAADYDRTRWAGRVGRQIHRQQMEILGLWLPPPAQGRVLELATGTGRVGAALVQQGYEVVGLDVSLAMVREAQRKSWASGSPGQIDLIGGSALDLPLASGSFDTCLCINAVNLIPDTGRLFHEVARILRPGGRFIFNFANIASFYGLAGLIAAVRGRAFARNVRSHWYTLGYITSLLERADLEARETVGHTIPPIYLDYLPVVALVDVAHRLSSTTWLRRLAPVLFLRAMKRFGE